MRIQPICGIQVGFDPISQHAGKLSEKTAMEWNAAPYVRLAFREDERISVAITRRTRDATARGFK